MKAKYVNINAGYKIQREMIQEMLEFGQSYEVESVEVSQSYTDIHLVGFDRSFNSVFFKFDDREEYIRLCKESFSERYTIYDN